MPFVEVAVNAALPTIRDTFSYSVPEGMTLQPGDGVLVPFGRRMLQGIVMQAVEVPAFNETNLRAEWKPPIGNSGNFGVIVDVFNVFNHGQVQSVQDRDNSTFEDPLTYNIGRNFRFGVRYTF